MNPLLLHQIADERVIHRRRSFYAQEHKVLRAPGAPRRLTMRVRTGVGGLLITVGTRVAGKRSDSVRLSRTST